MAYFRARDALELVSPEDLMARLRDGLVTKPKLRPEDEFALGHVPGALNVPLAARERRLAGLPAGKEIIAFWRGPYRVLSFEAVAAPRARGDRVQRVGDDYPEWRRRCFR